MNAPDGLYEGRIPDYKDAASPGLKRARGAVSQEWRACPGRNLL